MSVRLSMVAALTVAWAWPAEALCSYHGVDNAKTALTQEFRDSRWVVRAHVVSADYHWADGDESWTLYKLKVVKSFKGRLGPAFTFFTTRDSGGFYMDGQNAIPDFVDDYILFLTSPPALSAVPAVARKALWVNYACGRSGPWSKLSPAETMQLTALSQHG